MSSIIDLHTHFFGPVFFQTLSAAAHPKGDPQPGFTRLRAAGIDVPEEDPESHARRWLAEMDVHGIDRMVSFASLPEEAPSVCEGTAPSEGRLIPFYLVDPSEPTSPRRVTELTERYRARGLLLFPAMHRYDLSQASLDTFYATVAAAGLPLLVHMGSLQVRVRDLLGLPSNFDIAYATPSRLHGAAERFPDVRFIIPHFGGGYFEETLDLASRHSNVGVDTSSSNSWIRLQPGLTLSRVFRRSLDVLGAERIYFGTDSSVFPRGWRHSLYQEQDRALTEAGATSAERERIFSGNAAALLQG